MPFYTYRCKKTKETFEIKQSINDSPLEFWPVEIEGYYEGREVERIVGGNQHIILKGNGFYKTDYK